MSDPCELPEYRRMSAEQLRAECVHLRRLWLTADIARERAQTIVSALNGELAAQNSPDAKLLEENATLRAQLAREMQQRDEAVARARQMGRELVAEIAKRTRPARQGELLTTDAPLEGINPVSHFIADMSEPGKTGGA